MARHDQTLSRARHRDVGATHLIHLGLVRVRKEPKTGDRHYRILEPFARVKRHEANFVGTSTVIQATIKPPNPLFGPCWKSLNDYLKKRRLTEAQITEESEEGIPTNVPQIASAMSSGSKLPEELEAMMEPLLAGVGDAALLMAADGYGHAKVVGTEQEKIVTIRTRDNQKSFSLAHDPDPEELFRIALEQFEAISKERYLDHP